MTVIAMVLKSGGEYRAEHVLRLHQQLAGHNVLCVSDINVPGVKTISLRYNWPGWFSKMELFNPELIHGDILYLDLDTLITGDISHYLHDSVFRMLSDFYRPDRSASGVMYIPHHVKEEIWGAWLAGPDEWMNTRHGDQDVLGSICGRGVARFDERVKSYKLHVTGPGMPGYNHRSLGSGRLPADTDILCFHGNPRPWAVPPELLAEAGIPVCQLMSNVAANSSSDPVDPVHDSV